MFDDGAHSALCCQMQTCASREAGKQIGEFQTPQPRHVLRRIRTLHSNQLSAESPKPPLLADSLTPLPYSTSWLGA